MQKSKRTTVHDGTHASMERVPEDSSKRVPRGETLAAIAHDAHNIVAALGLYCDLLDVPGVLTAPYLHYGDELRLVVAASRRLVQRLEGLQSGVHPADQNAAPAPVYSPTLAGPAIRRTLDVQGTELPVRMTGEDLTRIVINLVKNSLEAMPRGGHIHLKLRKAPNRRRICWWLTLTVEESGLRIPSVALGNTFQAGDNVHPPQPSAPDQPPLQRGLRLFTARSINKAAGGCIHTAKRDSSGACSQIELPVGTC